jgi:DNA polymerase-3 subunit delta'
VSLPGIDAHPLPGIDAYSLPGIDAHPHARAVLVPVLEALVPELGGGATIADAGPPADLGVPAGAGVSAGVGRAPAAGRRSPAHAYLFHGPPGTGKRTVARAFAAALLLPGARAPNTVAGRVARDAHPDLSWVTPSGAGEMLVSDIEDAVVAAAAHTPFESLRRVFVIEDAHTMNDQAANRLLKTLEEPPPFAHLLLLAPTPREVLPTIASRCLLVRFDPLPSARIEERLRIDRADLGIERADADVERAGVEVERADADFDRADPDVDRADADVDLLAACARLGLGDARLAARLADAPGLALREGAQDFIRGALRGDTATRPWLGLLQSAKEAGAAAGEALAARVAGELELLPSKDRRRHEREAAEAQRRVERRARTAALDLALRLAQLWLRDLWCLALGAGELVHAVDRRAELEQDAAECSPAGLREGIELVQDARLRLSLNLSEELALESLAYRLQALRVRAA